MASTTETLLFENAFYRVTQLKERVRGKGNTYRIEFIYPEDARYFSVLYANFLETWKMRAMRDIRTTQESGEKAVILRDITLEPLTNYLTRRAGRLSYNETRSFFLSIGNVCERLASRGVALPFFTPDMFLVMDGGLGGGAGAGAGAGAGGGGDYGRDFFLINYSELHTHREEDGKIQITKPYSQHLFFPIDFKGVKALPALLPPNIWMFSLAVCAIYCLTGNDKIFMLSIDGYKKVLESIEHTKLYYALLRCLEGDWRKRVFLFV